MRSAELRRQLQLIWLMAILSIFPSTPLFPTPHSALRTPHFSQSTYKNSFKHSSIWQ
jgi:hypothetical protein